MITETIVPGQRWINDLELQLGLGVVTDVAHRTITLLFPAIDETRTYSRQNSPLTRIKFEPGQSIRTRDHHELTVVGVKEVKSIISYEATDDMGNTHSCSELDLDFFIELSGAQDRLLRGQIDRDATFLLRFLTLNHQTKLAQSRVRSLVGARTSLLPHQLYIVHEVASRFAPRVLLADEVGLGKTIEAGLIIQSQLIRQFAQRILILVPEPLVHQWYIEMVRRFNLAFSIFTAQNHDDNEELVEGNPFNEVRLALCSTEYLLTRPEQLENAKAAQWDILVVDEAHHLEWNEFAPGPAYSAVEELSLSIPGLLLLTGTPEQLGKTSHFARLRLLDPHRFNDLDQFVREERDYQPIANIVERLISKRGLDSTMQQFIQSHLHADELQQFNHVFSGDGVKDTERTREELIENLLDRHGIGRVMFRNTRETIPGFPERIAHYYPLTLPDEYLALEFNQLSLTPERALPRCSDDRDWWLWDPRIDWLHQLLKQNPKEKFLVIAAHGVTPEDLEEAFRTRYGFQSAVFNENMNIVLRDRAAAYFADPEQNCRVLFCSEIGSEGRNFQFAHHLVLFDLPLNPDLLEQRIGRLDRIGQSESINIHVPYLKDSPQEILFHWYKEGFNAFNQINPVGQLVSATLGDELERLLSAPKYPDQDTLKEFIQSTTDLRIELIEQMQAGRDRLLEHNSCRPKIAQALKAEAEQFDDEPARQEYAQLLWDSLGVDCEYLAPGIFVLKPSGELLAPLQTLPDDGLTVTYQRLIALANEDLQYLSWEHPLLQEAMEIILSSELGNAAVTCVKHPEIPPGNLILEAIFALEAPSSTRVQLARFLPSASLRCVLDQDFNHVAHLTANYMASNVIHIDKNIAYKVIKSKADFLQSMLEHCKVWMNAESKTLLNKATTLAKKQITHEIDRLVALQKFNPNIRDEEIDFLRAQLLEIQDKLAALRFRVDALRVIVNT